MTAAQPEPKPAHKGLWLAVALVAGLLAFTTWDVVRRSGSGSAVQLRRAAFDGDVAGIHRLLKAHPEWLNQPGSDQPALISALVDKGRVLLGSKGPVHYLPSSDKQFRQMEAYGATALYHALVRKQSRAAMVLIDAGANVNATLTNGYPAIAVAIQLGETNLVAVMHERGVRLDTVEVLTGLPLLHLAIHSHKPEMVDFLLKHGAPVNSTDRSGGTSLHTAVAFRQLTVVEMLVTNGADLSLTNLGGRTPLEIAMTRASVSTASQDVANWLSAYAATNPPSAKPMP